MDVPPSPERSAAAWRDDERESVLDDIRVDGERYYQRVCEGESRCGSVGTCMFRSSSSPSPITDDHTITAAERCDKGVGLYARPGTGTWGS